MVDVPTFFPLRKFPMARRVAKMCLKVSLFCNSRIDSFRSIRGSATSYEKRNVLSLKNIKIFSLPNKPSKPSPDACVVEKTWAEITDYKSV